MQYMFDGKLYKVVKITGPKHNLLALGFSEDQESIEIVDLNKSIHDDVNIVSSQVEKQVLKGIQEANDELGTNYKVAKIQFVSSDSPSDSIYIELSKLIIKRLKAGGEFIST